MCGVRKTLQYKYNVYVNVPFSTSSHSPWKLLYIWICKYVCRELNSKITTQCHNLSDAFLFSHLFSCERKFQKNKIFNAKGNHLKCQIFHCIVSVTSHTPLQTIPLMNIFMQILRTMSFTLYDLCIYTCHIYMQWAYIYMNFSTHIWHSRYFLSFQSYSYACTFLSCK